MAMYTKASEPRKRRGASGASAAAPLACPGGREAARDGGPRVRGAQSVSHSMQLLTACRHASTQQRMHLTRALSETPSRESKALCTRYWIRSKIASTSAPKAIEPNA